MNFGKLEKLMLFSPYRSRLVPVVQLVPVCVGDFTLLLCLFFQHGTPPLLIAAGCGNIQIIEVLMRKGAEIQAQDKVRTSLFCCDHRLLDFAFLIDPH